MSESPEQFRRADGATLDAAFTTEMEGRIYGDSETLDAKAWFKSGFIAGQSSTAAAQRIVEDVVRNDDSRDWGRHDGTTAYHLIERHATDWNDAGRMMESWRAQRTAATTPTAQRVSAGDEPCDAGDICIGCSPRNADGSCPDATPQPTGEAVACFRIHSKMGAWGWVDGLPDDESAKACAEMGWRIEYAYTHPAAQAEGRDTGHTLCVYKSFPGDYGGNEYHFSGPIPPGKYRLAALTAPADVGGPDA